MKKDIIILLIITFLVIGTLVYAFYRVGGPNEARDRKFDSERLYNLQYAIENYYSTKGTLPTTLKEAVTDYGGIQNHMYDPQTKKEYVYEAVDGPHYKLCATFLTSTKIENAKTNFSYETYYDDFQHPKGYHCFDFDANVYSYDIAPTPTRLPFPSISPVTQTQTFRDTNIASVKLLYPEKSFLHSTAHFPYGFFSSNTSEWGLITEDEFASVEVNFKNPVRLAEVRIDVDNCKTINCYVWSASAVTTDGNSVEIANNLPAGSLETGYINPQLNSQVTHITITLTRSIRDPSYIYSGKK